MIGHGQKFTRKKEQAIAALLSHRTIEEAAHSVGISFATLKRWLKHPEFQAEYLQARHEVVFQANARIQQHSGAAAAVLLKLMADPSTPASVRARAALCIMEHANKSLYTDDLEMRIARLEESVENDE
jgi:hypothetical protein